MTDVVRTIQLFGAFRRFGTTVAVEAPADATAAALKRRLAETLRSGRSDIDVDSLVAVSVLATEREVLGDTAVPPVDARLAVLPPVSGG
jgi:hypothetical protein